MWDVKDKKGRGVCRLFTVFYMNYVGCKAPNALVAKTMMIKFYLNYVGCKGL